MIIVNAQHFRFIERNYLFNKIKSSTTYIVDEAINNYLDEIQTEDLTFTFHKTDTGFTTRIFCNITEQFVLLDSLNSFALNFYLRKVKELSYEKAI
jgi:hypothetical protein